MTRFILVNIFILLLYCEKGCANTLEILNIKDLYLSVSRFSYTNIQVKLPKVKKLLKDGCIYSNGRIKVCYYKNQYLIIDGSYYVFAAYLLKIPKVQVEIVDAVDVLKESLKFYDQGLIGYPFSASLGAMTTYYKVDEVLKKGENDVLRFYLNVMKAKYQYTKNQWDNSDKQEWSKCSLKPIWIKNETAVPNNIELVLSDILMRSKILKTFADFFYTPIKLEYSLTPHPGYETIEDQITDLINYYRGNPFKYAISKSIYPKNYQTQAKKVRDFIVLVLKDFQHNFYENKLKGSFPEKILRNTTFLVINEN